jgi:hypothetical protein
MLYSSPSRAPKFSECVIMAGSLRCSFLLDRDTLAVIAGSAARCAAVIEGFKGGKYHVLVRKHRKWQAAIHE